MGQTFCSRASTVRILDFERHGPYSISSGYFFLLSYIHRHPLVSEHESPFRGCATNNTLRHHNTKTHVEPLLCSCAETCGARHRDRHMTGPAPSPSLWDSDRVSVPPAVSDGQEVLPAPRPAPVVCPLTVCLCVASRERWPGDVSPGGKGHEAL